MLVCAAVTALMVAAVSPVSAGKTPWRTHEKGVQSRIIVASADMLHDGKRLLGFEIKLSGAWKTYWRSPGDAGLPIEISQGGNKLDLLFPLPKRIEFYGIHTFAYADRVIVPFYLDESLIQAGTNLAASFMICSDICIPFNIDFALNSDMLDGGLAEDLPLKNWLAKVPQRGEGAYAGLSILKTQITGRPGKQRLVVDVSSTGVMVKPDIMAEAADGFQFSLPRLHRLAEPDRFRFVLPIMAPKKANDFGNRSVRLTFTDGLGNAIDRRVIP